MLMTNVLRTDANLWGGNIGTESDRPDKEK